MREDTWEMIVDGAAAEQISQGEWVMRRLYPPHIWAMLNHEPQNAGAVAPPTQMPDPTNDAPGG